MIIQAFATLSVKGVLQMDASKRIAEQWRPGAGTHFVRRVRALARHYHQSGRLLHKNQGGARSGSSYRGTSLLLHEGVESQVRTWLTAQKVGTMTPRRLARGLKDEIFPGLNITPIKPLTERTAQRWLI